MTVDHEAIPGFMGVMTTPYPSSVYPREEIEVTAEFPELNDAVREIWNITPTSGRARGQGRLLNLRLGQYVLDIGCGNGQFTRLRA